MTSLCILDTPVLFIVFNRPDLTERVFNEIKKAAPAKLYVSADGPRNDQEIYLTEEVKSIVKKVDWPCVVHYRFSKENQGVRFAGFNAINWIFEREEEAIILEDDCLPSPSFFNFCANLLKYYRNHASVMHIGGTSFQPVPNQASYYFTRNTYIWGWATWRRAWAHYDLHLKHWPAFERSGRLKGWLKSRKAVNYWTCILDNVYQGKHEGWDYQWLFTTWNQQGISIAPNVNLISNIGFDSRASHTLNPDPLRMNLPSGEMIEILHPENMEIDWDAEKEIWERFFFGKPKSLYQRTIGKWKYQIGKSSFGQAIKSAIR